MLIKKICLHIYPSSFSFDSRMIRSCRSTLKAGIFNEALIFAVKKENLPEIENIDKNIKIIRLDPIIFNKKAMPTFLKAIGWYLSCIKKIADTNIRSINCHSIYGLPLSVFIKFWKKGTLIYEPHELETETINMKNKFLKKISFYLEKYLLKFCNEICVVNSSIAKWYKKKYNLPKVWIVKNVPQSVPKVSIIKGSLRKKIKVNPKKILFIYQGLLTPGRGIEIILQVFSKNENFNVVFLGNGELQALIKLYSQKYPNIHYAKAVSPDKIFEYTIDADIGFSLIENTCLNNYYSLPNKLYEYAFCGVPQIVSSFPEIKKFVSKHNSGWAIKPRTDQLANLIKKITVTEINKKKENCLNIRKKYNWKIEEKKLLKMYSNLNY